MEYCFEKEKYNIVTFLIRTGFVSNLNNLEKMNFHFCRKINKWQTEGFTYTILHGCTAFGEKELVTLLLDKGFSVDLRCSYNNGKTPLMIALEEDQADIVDLLLKREANLFLEDSNGNTALDYSKKRYIYPKLLSNMDNFELLDEYLLNKENYHQISYEFLELIIEKKKEMKILIKKSIMQDSRLLNDLVSICSNYLFLD